MRALKFLRPEHLDIPDYFRTDAQWTLAQKELQKINSYKVSRKPSDDMAKTCKPAALPSCPIAFHPLGAIHIRDRRGCQGNEWDVGGQGGDTVCIIRDRLCRPSEGLAPPRPFVSRDRLSRHITTPLGLRGVPQPDAFDAEVEDAIGDTLREVMGERCVYVSVGGRDEWALAV